VTKIFDPTDPTSRHIQLKDSIQTKLEEAAVARAKLGPTADEKRLAKTLEGLVVPMPSKKAS
jgi:hypothetical protein